jgi:tetratricopeptide (TPR) repeat protein
MTQRSPHDDWRPSPVFLFLFIVLAILSTACFLLAEETASPTPRELMLVPHRGEAATDRAIREAQGRVESGFVPVASIERLGWAYVAKSRESFDAGYLVLAESCASAIESFPEAGKSAPEALLLRGHVFTQWHRFAEAEVLASELVSRRGIPFDHLLLGDALMEQGKLEEAIVSYQAGADLRPDLQSYARAGWIRWLIGDLDGAIEATGRAVKAGTRQDPDALAWVTTRLATFLFTAGNLEEAEKTAKAALEVRSSYPPALFLSGRILLARGEAARAVLLLETAAKANPMPDYHWLLAEALREAGREAEAIEVEIALAKSGPAIDGRTMALFLATRSTSLDEAEKMAREELGHRQDVFTHDALAFALHQLGRNTEARDQMDLAVREGTEDGRLFLHAALIAASVGEVEEAGDWLVAATHLRHTLLPSECRSLDALSLSLTSHVSSATNVAAGNNQPKNDRKP